MAYGGGSAGSTRQVIVPSLGSGRTDVIGVGNGPSFTGSGPLSANGRFVAFYTDRQVFVRGRLARKTTLVSVAFPKS